MTSLLTFILMLTGYLEVWMLVCIAILAAASSTFHFAAFDASYAMLVPDRLLPRANGMMQTTWSLAGIVSPALAAFIIALPSFLPHDVAPFAPLALRDGTALVIAIDAVTFLLCAVVLLIVHIPSPTRSDLSARGPSKPSLWGDVREGARYIWQRPPLLWLVVTFAVANLASAPTGIIVPLLVKFNLASDWKARGYTFETALALLSVASGLGGLLGGVLMSTWGGLRQYRVYGVVIPMVLAGMLQVVYGLSPFVLLSAAAAFFGAAMHPVLNAHSQAIWQSHTPRELQGRVFSIRRLIAWSVLPISTAATGALVGGLDPGRVFASLGAFWALFCVAQLFNPDLLRVERA
jgi:MFS family permease